MTSLSDPKVSKPFSLARFRPDSQSADVQLGLVVGDRVRAISASELGAPDLNSFLADSNGWTRLESLVDSDSGWLALTSVVLTAPVEPRQVLQTGANYRSHVIDLVVASLAADDPRSPEEARQWAGELMDKRAQTGLPYFFIGLPAAVVGDDVPVVLPGYSDQHDWELELAVVIGERAFRVSEEEALQHVAGYTIVNDLTTRDLVFRKDMKDIGTDWYRGKNAPGFLPTGPFLTPARFMPDPGNIHLTLRLNGDIVQDASTEDLVFGIPALISAASQNMPLLPGDLLLTGSPSGNGISRGRLLRAGDVLEGTITGLGTQTLHFVDEDTK